MQNLRLAVFLFFAGALKTFAQCPVAGFTVPPNVCIGDSFPITNNTIGATGFAWDFCAGDLEQIPLASSLGTLGLSNPDGLDLAYDGNNWYAFVCQPNAIPSSKITRFFIGNSLDNPLVSPVDISINNGVTLINSCWDIELIKDGNYWYALVNRAADNEIVRIDLDSLDNNNPNAVDLNIPGLSNPFHSTLVKDGANFIYLVTNNSPANSITVVNFGNSIANIPSAGNFPAVGVGGPGPIGITVGKDCDTWYGFVTFSSDGNILRVNFGNSITSTPVSTNVLTTLPYSGTREIKLLNENSKWYALIMNSTGNALGRLSFGTSLNSNTPSFFDFPGFGFFNYDVDFTLEKDGSKYYGFSARYFTGEVDKFSFTDNCSANISVSSDMNPSGIIYNSLGINYISISVTDTGGNTDYYTDSVNVIAPPIAGFYTGAACVNQPVNFFDTSFVNIGSITNWFWDFGDSTTDTVQNPVHVFTNDTSYNVTLTVTSDAGCSGSVTATIVVQDLPTANFSFPNNQCAHANVPFTDLSVPPSGANITEWEWNFGDGTPTDTVQNPQHTFDSTGTFNVQLIAFTSSGCSDTIILPITIVPGPLADFTISQTCFGDSTLFTNNSSISGGGTITFSWDFGDASPGSTDTNPSHLYNAAGIYTVQLIATANGCEDTVQIPVHISSKANPGFITSPFIACAGSPLQFIDTSVVVAGDTIALSTWDFGDTSPIAIGDTVYHTYAAAGPYNVTLTVTTLTSCDTTITITINVVQCPVTPCPIADFILPDDTICAQVPFSITNATIAATNFAWDFCAGDIEQGPDTILSLGAQPISGPDGIDLAFDGTDWYAFVCNNSTITRFFIGNSLNNPLTLPTTLSVTGASMAFCQDIEVINDGNFWYALVNTNDGGAGTDHLIKIEFGNLLDNNAPSAVDLNISGLNNPWHSTLVKDGSNFVYLVANNGGNSITVVTFINSLTNIPTSGNFPVVGFGGPIGITVAKDCDTWYGFASFSGDNIILRINFGNSLTSTPISTGVLTTIPYSATREIKLVNENSKWYALIMNVFGDAFGRLSFGTDLGSSATTFTDFPGMALLDYDVEFTIENENSKYYCFTSGYFTFDVKRIIFSDSCSANNSISNEINPTGIIYNSPGTYYISLTATDNDGNTDFISDTITVLPVPDVNYTTSAACMNTPMSFFDLTTISSGTLNGWFWTFGDGDSSVLQNPVHTYSSTGTYPVTLTVTSDANCSATYADSITVHELPVAGFSFTDNQCSETPVLFNDTSLAPLGDIITGWLWTFGDGDSSVLQNPVHSYDTSGIFIIQLIVFSDAGCSDTITDSINVLFRPRAGFTVSQTCIGEIVQFTDTTIATGGLSYNWNFGDLSNSTSQSPSHSYALFDSTYNVQLIVIDTINGCSDTVIQSVHIGNQANPGFIFIPDTLCAGNAVQFIDTSIAAPGDSISLSSWSFGDSTSGFGDTITHVYANSGIYTITLTVTTWTACDTSISKTVTVLESPVAWFTSGNVCEGFAMNFTDSSTTPVGTTLLNYIWNFGDNTTDSTNINTSHTYTNSGTYLVTHTVINNFGCLDTVSDSVTVYAKPLASFDQTDIACLNDTVTFTNLSSIPNSSDTISTYLWDFGDGSPTSPLINPQHVYQNLGNYNVTLTVMSEHGCIDSTTFQITIANSPHFDFTFSHTCLNEITQFNFIDLDTISPPAQFWNWDFGDSGPPSFIANPTYSYDSSGIYTVTLTASNTLSCSTTVIKNIIVHPLPVAGMMVSDTVPCNGGTISFTDTSSITSGFISSYQWDFGDGSPVDNNQNTSHVYDSTDTFTVLHIVTSGEGCKDTTVATIAVNPVPVASFIANPSFGSPPLTVIFFNTSQGGNSYQWYFGDGDSSTLFSPTHVYMDTGYYTAMLIATNIYGCKDTATAIISTLVPYLEMGITDIRADMKDNLLTIKADLRNNGNVYINRFQITTWTETGSPVNEQWQGVFAFAPADIMLYTFAARYVVDPGNMPTYYCVEISEINDTTDALLSNNKKCKALEDVFQTCQVFPNPVADDFTFCIIVPFDGIAHMRITDMLGQAVKENVALQVKKGFNEFNFSMLGIAQAMYIVEVTFGDNMKTLKLIKR